MVVQEWGVDEGVKTEDSVAWDLYRISSDMFSWDLGRLKVLHTA